MVLHVVGGIPGIKRPKNNLQLLQNVDFRWHRSECTSVWDWNVYQMKACLLSSDLMPVCYSQELKSGGKENSL